MIYNNKKAEYRIYILVASVKPAFVLLHKGFIKTSLGDYDKNSMKKEV